MTKGPIESIEKDLRHVEKNIKKNWWRYFIILMGSIVVLIIVLSFAGMRIRFVLRDTLIISVAPPEESFTIPNDRNQSVTFEVEIINSRFCTANCSYALYDRSESLVLAQGEASFRGNSQFEKSFILEPYRRGSGQKIFNFDFECQNVRSFFCATKSPIRRASSFIVLNYELTSDEAIYKGQIKPILVKAIDNINNASVELEIISDLLGPKFIKKDELQKKERIIEKAAQIKIKEVKIAKDYWALEEYVYLNNYFKDSLLNTSAVLKMAQDLKLETEAWQSEENELIREYNGMIYSFLDDVDNTFWNDSNISSRINELTRLFEDVAFKVKNEYKKLEGFSLALENISSELQDFERELVGVKKIFAAQGKNLTETEYKKKCEIGYCEEPSGDVCVDLKRILGEYNTRWFPVPDNISAEPYYIVSDVVEILIENETLDFVKKYCANISYNVSLEALEEIHPEISIENEDWIENDIAENLPQCCVYGKCADCCASEECRNDPKLFPVLLIHGHSLLRAPTPEPLLDVFNKIQYQLQDDGFVNAGTVYYNLNFAQKENEWGLARNPITVKASYYYDYYYSLGKYVYITRSTDNIDTYAVRLNDIIKGVKYKTGKPKVNLVAHSMGGLVVRRYIQIFGDDSLDKVILIATPNHGIEGPIRQWCQVFGEKKECEDMYADSVFIKKLNDPNFVPKSHVFTVSGIGCPMDGAEGDGVVTLNSSMLEYAGSFVVNGSCTDAFGTSLHGDILDIDTYPEVYEDLLEVLKD